MMQCVTIVKNVFFIFIKKSNIQTQEITFSLEKQGVSLFLIKE